MSSAFAERVAVHACRLAQAAARYRLRLKWNQNKASEKEEKKIPNRTINTAAMQRYEKLEKIGEGGITATL